MAETQRTDRQHADGFFPSRWRAPLAAMAVVGLLVAPAGLCWLAWWALTGTWTLQQWSSLVSILLILTSSIRILRLARRIGVTVNEEGVRLVGGTFLNPAGFWTWDQVENVDVVDEEHIQNAPRQVLLRTLAEGSVRLGPITGRDEMVDQIRSRLRSR